MRSSSLSSSSSGRINIAASAQRLDVDNRISLRFYYRIADNILKQADIFREEKNTIDLYVMLLRFSSLVSETIPDHREYKASIQSKKVYLKKQLLNTVTELEELKPIVQQKISELNRRHANQVNGCSFNHQNDVEWPPVKKKSFSTYDVAKGMGPAAWEPVYRGVEAPRISGAKPVRERHQRIFTNFPHPREETLSRHSILGPNGLYGQWQPPKSDKQMQIQYPSNIDLTPVEILGTCVSSVQQSVENGFATRAEPSTSEPMIQFRNQPNIKSENTNSVSEAPILDSVETIKEENQMSQADHCMISFETEIPVQPAVVRQPSPPAVLTEVQDLIPEMPSQVGEVEDKMMISSPEDIIRSEAPLQLHISTTLMDSFMKLAKTNTDKDLETCGVLAGSLKNRKFYVTALIIPKQESTANTCQTTNEEEIFEVQDNRCLFPLGWIHTHPTQSCFMSSVDVHTHYSYQIMLPEAVAIVMAPRDTSKKHGIFRLTTPGGMSVIRHCQQRGFHPHDPPEDGSPIYTACTDVYMNPNLKFDVIDLR